MATIAEALLLAFDHHRAGRLAAAMELYDRILAADDGQTNAWHLSGIALAESGRPTEAATRIRRAIGLDAAVADYHANLGGVLRSGGDLASAAVCCRRALALRPDFADAWAGLAGALDGRDPRAAAEAALRALRLVPERFAGDAAGLAARLSRAGRHRTALCLDPARADDLRALAEAGGPKATALLRRCARVRPEDAEGWYRLACALEDAGDAAGTAAALRRVLALRPGSPHALFLLAHLADSGYRFDAALAGYRRVALLLPDQAQAHRALATARLTTGEVAAAVASYRAALACDPGERDTFSSLLFALCFLEGADLDAVYATFRRFDAAYARALAPPAAALPAAAPDPERRLRVGYVSPNFYGHPCGHFVLPVVENHDPAAVAVVCYATSPVRDAWSEAFARCAERFVACHADDDAALAARVRDDGIDIVVDCSGHMAGHRLMAFARRPAPLQVSYPLFPNTTGLDAMDYRIMDHRFAPPWADRWHAEALVRLPDAHVVYKPRPSPSEPPPRPPSADTGSITFGSFNTLAKLGDATVAVWARILHGVPGSRLLVKWRGLADPGVAGRLAARFAARGIAPERIVPLGWAEDPYAAYAAVDIALDPLYANGGTTTCDALWMGVPVVSCAGTGPFARVGLCHLTVAGLPELVADSAEGFVDLAVALAKDPERLARLRRGLRERVAASPLMDARRYTRHLEAAYRTMWRRHCAGLPPTAFAVPPADR